jgi:hypothetical protein
VKVIRQDETHYNVTCEGHLHGEGHRSHTW